MNMRKANETVLQLLPNKMAIKFDMFGALVKNRILGDINGCKAITLERYRQNKWNLKLR